MSASSVEAVGSVPPVVLRDGDDASGMAVMIAGLLEDNLRDFPGRARVAARTRGSVVLTASDRDVSITVTFGSDGVEIADGARPGVAAMSGPWLTMSRVCSGRNTPWRAIRERELALGGGRSVWALPAAGFVLSVPASFYEDASGGSDADGAGAGDGRGSAADHRVVAGAVVAGATVAVVGGSVLIARASRPRRRRRRRSSSPHPNL
ncbi:MAG TPA: hypothetical protein PKC57_08185 [Microthrixaceae bacterium]|nr:hypothetical protein [Microthrixaceae bacterium]